MINENLTAVFKALSHPIRMSILDQLKEGPKTTGDLDSIFPDVSRYAVMKHLNALMDADLILIRREGRSRLNYLNVVPLQQVYERWVSQYQSGFAESLTSLKQSLERSNEEMTDQGLKHDVFQIEQEVTIHASPQKVFEGLTRDIGQWWAYRLCGEGSRMTMDPHPGGKFLEEGIKGANALWGTVQYVKENEEIRLNGLLGMTGAVNSAYSFKLEPKGDATVLKLTHQAVGLIDPEWEKMHAEGWEELLGDFLKNYLEHGKRPEIE